jgi:hypothetical protein
MIALGVLVTLVVLGTDLALEKAFSQHGKAVVTEPVKMSDAVVTPVNLEPVDMPAATDSSQEYDRSDLLLSQG